MTSLSPKDFRPKRHRGQNFLVDKNILGKIIAAARLTGAETVVEVGAGTGALTRALAQKAKKVIAVELDRELFALLEQEFAMQSNVELIQEDIRVVPHTRFGRRNGEYAVVANIPYNITSHLIRSFLEERPRPSRMILLIQKEVVSRMCAAGGKHSLLELSVRFYAECKMLFPVSRNCFFPKPNVESAVIEIVPHESAPSAAEQETFFKVAKSGFAAKRKKLISNLAQGLSLPPESLRTVFQELKISENARAEELSLEQWKTLSRIVK